MKALLVPLILLACNSGRDAVRFELRGMQTKSSESEYSTTFTHEGTVLAIGDSPAAKEPYAVLFEVKHISGGDPDVLAATGETHSVVVFVTDGAGNYREYAGSRRKKTSYSAGDTWEQEKVDIRPLGYIRFNRMAPPK
jgi:hypothetical protein